MSRAAQEQHAAEQAQRARARVLSLGLGRARHLAPLSTSVLARITRAAHEQRAFEQAQAAARRKDLPLVLSPTGRSWSKAELSKFFDGLIRLVCSEERAKQLSVHSFRVWLACALLAAGATPEQIMLMVRWSSEAARKLYARLAMTTQCSLHTGALHASFDSIRAHTLLDAASATGASSDVDAAAEALRVAVGLLGTVTDASGARVASAAELRRTCAIDEDDVLSMLEASRVWCSFLRKSV